MSGSVVKARFGSASSGGLKSSLAYFAHRPDYDGERANREIITAYERYQLDQDGNNAIDALERHLDVEDKRYMYSVVMSPGDEQLTARQTENWARNVLEQNNIHQYAVVVHAGEQGHTDHPHVHVLIPSDERLTVQKLHDLRATGDAEKELLNQQQQWRYEVQHQLSPHHLEPSSDGATTSGGSGQEWSDEAATSPTGDTTPKRQTERDWGY